MNARRFALLATLLLTLPAVAQVPQRSYLVKKDASTVTYKLTHKLHEVVGTAHPSIGKALLMADGTLQVQVRANVKDFDSGNANRDVHMQEVTEAAKFPSVTFKGTASGVKMPETFPATVPVTLDVELTFHGVLQKMQVPMSVTFLSAKDVSASGTFDISLDAFKVERPSLMMVKVEDKVAIDTKLVLVQEGA